MLRGSQQNLNMMLHGDQLQRVNTGPYLGVQIDQYLKWDYHVQQLCKRISGKLAVLSRLRKVLSPELLRRQYIKCIQPCIDYAISVWGVCSERNKNMVTRLQHRAARIISNNFDYRNTAGSQLVKNLKWQTLDERRDFFTATLMYKCINGLAPTRLADEVVMSADTHNRNTRATAAIGQVNVPTPKREIFRNSFKYRGAVLWNQLPDHIKAATNIDHFKYMYKKQYFN